MTPQAEALEDAALAHTDADLIVAGITELEELVAAGRLDANNVTDVARDIMPRLDALKSWLTEQYLTELERATPRRAALPLGDLDNDLADLDRDDQ